LGGGFAPFNSSNGACTQNLSNYVKTTKETKDTKDTKKRKKSLLHENGELNMVLPMNKNARRKQGSKKSSQNKILFGSFNKQSGSSQIQSNVGKKQKTSLRSFKEKFRLYTGEPLHSTKVIFRLAKSIIAAILPWSLLCSGYGFTVSLLNHFGHLLIFSDSKVLPQVVLSLNIVLSLLLVFRTNTAHDRFWEARKLWGALVNAVRNLARGIWIYIEESQPQHRSEKESIMRLVVAFTIAMKLHLRRDPMNSELAPLMSSFQYHKLKDVNHAPLEISLWIGDYLQSRYEHQHINVFQVNTLHELMDKLIDILGGCERILKTPVPIVYTITLKTLLIIYVLLLPWELVNGLTWWTGPLLGFISFIILGIDEIGSEIEEPFGHDPNDLPLDVICNTMLRNVEDLIHSAPCQSNIYNSSDRAA
jgi:putative membrane protein